MDKLSIRLKIFDVEYTIKSPANEEILVREAGKLIQERVSFHRRGKDGILDRAVIAQIALECVVATLKSNAESQRFQDMVGDKITQLDKVISSALL